MSQPIVGSPFTIGEAARRSEVSAKMVRHYESLGLLQSINRTDSGYRQYTDKEVHTLRFIRWIIYFFSTAVCKITQAFHEAGFVGVSLMAAQKSPVWLMASVNSRKPMGFTT